MEVRLLMPHRWCGGALRAAPPALFLAFGFGLGRAVAGAACAGMSGESGCVAVSAVSSFCDSPDGVGLLFVEILRFFAAPGFGADTFFAPFSFVEAAFSCCAVAGISAVFAMVSI